MGALLDAFPGARRALFAKYHVGGCSSCGFQLSETLAEVCARHGVALVGGRLEPRAEGEAVQEAYFMPDGADFVEIGRAG